MPAYRLTPPGEIVHADGDRPEYAHTVLTGMTLVGKPREVVIRRVSSSVRVELVEDASHVDLDGGLPLL